MLPIPKTETEAAQEVRLSWRDRGPTLVAALLSSGAVALLIFAFDSVSVFERPAALESLAGTVFWIASASIGACGTIAALMLTTLSLMEHLETRRLGPRFLFHLRLTVVGAIATIGLAIGALLLTTFPLAGGADVKPPGWQVDAVFFGLQGLTALMVGGFSVVLSSLYATISDIFRNLPQHWVDSILSEDETAADEAAAPSAPERPSDAAERTLRTAPGAAAAADVVVSQAPRQGSK